jgi:hypothetical protein
LAVLTEVLYHFPQSIQVNIGKVSLSNLQKKKKSSEAKSRLTNVAAVVMKEYQRWNREAVQLSLW